MDQTVHRIYYGRSQNLSFPSLFPIIPTTVSSRPMLLVACVSMYMYVIGSYIMLPVVSWPSAIVTGWSFLSHLLLLVSKKRESENFVRRLPFIPLDN